MTGHHTPGPAHPAHEDTGFSRRTGVWLAVVSAVSLGVALVVMAFAGDLTEVTSAEADTFSRSALGHRAFVELLERDGFTVHSRRNRQVLGGRRGSAIVLAEPAQGMDFSQYIRNLRMDALERGMDVVLVLPKWHGVADPAHDGRWVRSVSLVPLAAVQEVLEGLDGLRVVRRTAGGRPTTLACTTSRDEPGTVELIEPQFVTGAAARDNLVSTSHGALIVRVTGRHGFTAPLYVVSDPDLMNNHGLPRGDNVLVIRALLAEVADARTVIFDEVAHGYVHEPSFFAELLRFPLVVVVLHLVLVFGLVVWAAGYRFGKAIPAQPRLAPGTRALIDNTAKLLTYGGRARVGAIRYFDETMTSLALHYHLPRGLPRDELVARLGLISAHRGLPLGLVTVRSALEALDDRDRRAGAHAVGLTTALHRWREEMMDGP